MSTKLTHRLSLYIPERLENSDLDLMPVTETAGGVTMTTGKGGWVDESDGKFVVEEIFIFTWWYAASAEKAMLERSAEAIAEMFALGEKCVMTEKYTPSLGLRAHLFYP